MWNRKSEVRKGLPHNITKELRLRLALGAALSLRRTIGKGFIQVTDVS